MVVKEEYATIDGPDIGLDRADINRQGQIEIPNQAPQPSHDHREDDEEEERKKQSSLHRVRVSLSEKKHDAGLKIRKKLHISKMTDTDVDDDLGRNDSVLANPVTEESESRLSEKLPVPDKATMKDFLHSPIDTTKDKISGHGNQEVAANIAAREISHGQDVDLLNAHKKMQNADTTQEREKAAETFEELMKERQNMFVRWTLDRHITKARILPSLTFVRKPKEAFMRKEVGGQVVMNWKAYGSHLLEYSAHQYGGQYIGYGMDHPAPSKKTIMPNVERLIVASAPFQEFIMTTRRVYRWEKPAETSKYLIVYAVLWYLDLLLPGMLSVLVYLVIQRNYHAPTMEDLRQDIERTENQQVTALTLTEFIEKEGDDEWADKIVEEVGPWLMVQLADLANFFEVMRNFYEWRVPTRTMATLSILIVTILATAIVPAWLFIRAITLGMGVSFFALFPFAVAFPEYRLLASLPKQLFWKIPTHAEWSIKAIQAEGTRYQQTHPASTLATNPNDTTTLPAGDYGHYASHYNDIKGRLTISHSSVRFSSHDNVLFTLAYSDIQRIEKIDRMVEQTFPLSKLKSDSGKDLKIIAKVPGGVSGVGVVNDLGAAKENKEFVLVSVDLRDQVFSQILGFSDTTWQVVW